MSCVVFLCFFFLPKCRSSFVLLTVYLLCGSVTVGFIIICVIICHYGVSHVKKSIKIKLQKSYKCEDSLETIL